MLGLTVGGKTINDLNYADEAILKLENEKELQKLLNIVRNKSRSIVLDLNSKKTEEIVIS